MVQHTPSSLLCSYTSLCSIITNHSLTALESVLGLSYCDIFVAHSASIAFAGGMATCRTDAIHLLLKSSLPLRWKVVAVKLLPQLKQLSQIVISFGGRFLIYSMQPTNTSTNCFLSRFVRAAITTLPTCIPLISLRVVEML